MQAAITAADIGFDVVLAEQESELGGIFRFADHDTHKYDLKRFKDRLIRRIGKRSWIDVRLNTRVDGAFIQRERPDFIICAVGSSQITPPIPGLAEHAVPLLEGYGGNYSGKRVVMLGGGLAGCEAAYDIADRGAAAVSVVEMQAQLAPGPTDAHKIDLFRGFEHYGIRQYPSTRVTGVLPGKVLADGPDGPLELEADAILYAFGMRANPTAALREAAGDIPFELVGDCVEPTKVYHAVYDGVTAAIRAWRRFNETERK